MSNFNYDDTSADDETVRAVAAEISGNGLRPLSDEERAERELWREQQRQRDHEMRLAYERDRAAKAAEAKRQAAVVAQQERAFALQRRRAEISHEVRDREHASMRLQLARQEQWRHGVETATNNAVRQHRFQQRLAMIDDWAPKPPPEPPVVVVEPDDDEPDRRWFQR